MLVGRTSKPTAQGAIGFGVVFLLTLGMLTSYVDRGVLSTAAPLIKDELRLSNTEAGLLLSAFFWSYTPFQPVAGWLAERINPYRTLAIGAALWSFSTIAAGFAVGFTSLFLLRLLLGMAESAVFPCNAKLLARDLPAAKLGTANGMIGIGISIGPAVGTFAAGLVMAMHGWRPAFLLFGLISASWLLPWLVVTRHFSARPAAAEKAAAPPFLAILARREYWGAALGHFSHNYAIYFILTWLPLYLVKARGFSLTQMSELGAGLYILNAISTQICGLLADRWMAAGASSTKVRKGFIIAGHCGVGLCLLISALAGPSLSIVALLASGLFFGMNIATMFAIGQTLGGPSAAGKWMGLQNCLANFAGILAPILTGYVVDRTGQFALAFVLAAAISLVGVVGWGLIIRRVETLAWE